VHTKPLDPPSLQFVWQAGFIGWLHALLAHAKNGAPPPAHPIGRDGLPLGAGRVA